MNDNVKDIVKDIKNQTLIEESDDNNPYNQGSGSSFPKLQQ